MRDQEIQDPVNSETSVTIMYTIPFYTINLLLNLLYTEWVTFTELFNSKNYIKL